MQLAEGERVGSYILYCETSDVEEALDSSETLASARPPSNEITKKMEID